MTTIRILPGGTTGSYEPELRTRNLPSAGRGDTQGWSKGVAGRLRGWLCSINASGLTGYGYAFTFTVRDCPGDAGEWSSAVKRLCQQFRDRGAIRYSWVTEWQKRGVPHLHGVVYFPNKKPFRVEGATKPTARWWLWSDWEQEIGSMWLEGCKALKKWGSGGGGQDVQAITKIAGWLMYMAKHAGRGQASYQRDAKSVPVGWSNTGRMWGKGGDWPTVAALRVQGLNRWEEARRLQLLRCYAVSQARRLLRRAETPHKVAVARSLRRRAKGATKHPYKRKPYGVFTWTSGEASLQICRLSLVAPAEVLDEGTGEIVQLPRITENNGGIDLQRYEQKRKAEMEKTGKT